jgi:hypothetical protein
MKINYDGRRFRSVETSSNAQVSDRTVFEYQQHGNIVTAEYSGGEIRKGHLIALVDENGCLYMHYHHVVTDGQIMTGICRSTPELLTDGRIRLHEKWQWTSGDGSKGSSVLEEVISPK